MDDAIYIDATYLKVLSHADESLSKSMFNALGPHAEEILQNDYIYGADIDKIFDLFVTSGLESRLLRFGNQLSIASHGPLGFAVLSAPDLQSALSVLTDYSIIRTSAYTCELRQKNARIEYVFHDQTGGGLSGQWLIETGLSAVQRLIESIMAHPLGSIATISFSCAAPAYREELEAFYGVECAFESDESAISIPESWCRMPSPLYDQDIFQTNLSKCRALKLELEGSSDLAESIRLKLAAYFDARMVGNTTASQLPDLESLADDHHVSARTLIRKLKRQNTSYKTLLEEARRTKATELLSSTHLTVADIAYNLAYQESANFVRAFKTWFDTTPAAWRRRP